MIRSLITALPLFFLLLGAGCSSPQQRLERGLAEAEVQMEAGETAAAIETLIALEETFPENAEIQEQLGGAYSRRGDAFAAAIAYETAFQLDNQRAALLLFAAEAYTQVPDMNSTLRVLESYTTAGPEVPAEVWFRIGAIRADQGQVNPAIEAYLAGFQMSAQPPTAEQALAVASLYRQAGNRAQAETWFRRTVEVTSRRDINRLEAYLALLEMEARRSNWPQVGVLIQQLDREFPGALRTSEMAPVRSMFAEWQQARADAERERLALTQQQATPPATSEEVAEVVQPQPQPITIETPPATDSESPSSNAPTETASFEEPARNLPPDQFPPETNQPSEGVAAMVIAADSGGSGMSKMQAVEEATTARIEEPVTLTVEEETTPPPPAEKLVGLETTPEQIPELPVETSVTEPEPENGNGSGSGSGNVDAFLAEAEQARINGDPQTAIEAYMNALRIQPDLAVAWYGLSRAYLLAGNPGGAEFPALEAVRNAPTEPEYTLNYLEILQQTASPEVMMSELERAKRRFPTNPAITLALAQGYERIERNRRAAAYLYREFLRLSSPSDPLRPQAEAGLARMGG